MKNIILSMTVVSLLFVTATVAHADGSTTKTECQPTYGGGQNCKTITTKGGNVIYPAPATNTTPSTGAEMLGLIGLIPTTLAGLALRKKTN